MKRCLLLAGLLLSIPILPFPIAHADGLIVVTDLQMLPAPGSQGPPSWPHPLPSPRRIYRFAPLEVTYHHVDVHIKDQISVTSVDQEFYNPNAHELEGTYLFPVPKGAHIDRFSMEIGGRQVEAELLPAAKARKLYEDIVRNLKDPALLEYAGRELFKVRVFPIEPHSRKRIKVSYSQLLKTESGLVSYVYPLNTEKFSARPIKNVSVQIKLETRRPIKALYSPSHPVDIRRHGATRAQITYEASQTKPDTDLQLLFAAEDSEVGLHLLTSKGHDRDSGGYFLLLASPGKAEKAELVSKDVVFVLDTSGSMAGTKLDQAKKALQFCVENLREQDRFEIIRFATETEPLFEEVKPATSENQKRAFDFIRNLKPIGGTAIEPALRKALTLRKAGSDRPFIVIFLTDGRPTVGPTHEDEILSSVRKAGEGNTRIFCFGIGHDVNTHLLDRITEETRAFSQYVLPEEDLELKLSSFFSRINAPVLSDLLIHFPDGMRAKSLYPSNLPDLYHGDQLVIVGRFDGPATGRAKLQGKIDGHRKTFSFEVNAASDHADNDFIPRLWATRRIGHLLDEIRLRGENSELKEEVSELARKFGIVTPYTAYLIMEDEERRRVPLAAQSLPQLRQNAEAQVLLGSAWNSLQRDRFGAAAVGAARYGLALRAAENVVDGLNNGQQEGERVLSYFAGGAVKAGQTHSPANSARIGAAGINHSPQDSVLAAQTTSQFVHGRSFFQNGSQWVDALVQQHNQPNKVRVQFNSTEYFALASREPKILPWLALGQNVQFVWNNTLYEIYE